MTANDPASSSSSNVDLPTPFDGAAEPVISPAVDPMLHKALSSNASKFMNQLSHKISSKEPVINTKSSVVNAFDNLQHGDADDVERGRQRMAMSVSVTWSDLTYTVPVRVGRSFRKRGTKIVLQGVNGHVPPERLLAIMGPTGCGKTSVLNALAGRLPVGGKLDGTILVNGQPRTKAFRTISAYVMQDDVLFSNLSVRETLRVAADLRLPSSVPAATKAQVVDDVIAELGLAKAANTWIGNEIVRGVSGGERKRTNIGVELLSNPSIVFLDEPTSGLDAFQAQNVMESLWALAKHGRTVLCTIHQPRSSIYKMFDLLLLLSEGQTMYFGLASKAVGYFTHHGFPCPELYNPADFFLDVVSMDYRTPEVEEDSRQRVKQLADTFVEQPAVDDHRDLEKTASLDNVHANFKFANSWIRQFMILSKRAFTQNARDVLPLFFSFVLTAFIGLLLGVVYFQIDYNQPGIQDRMGILFFIVLFACFSNFQPVMDTFPSEQKVVMRERAAKSYRVLPYYISKMLAETPMRIVSTLLFSSIVYWMVGLNPGASNFFIFASIILLEGLSGLAFGIMISALVPNEKIAMAVSPAFLVFMMLFGGFYANTESMPAWLSWIKYISFLYYAFSGLAVNEFRDECCWACDKECLSFSDNGVCIKRGFNDAGGCLRTGNQILDRWGFGDWPLWASYVGLAVSVPCAGPPIISHKNTGSILVMHSLGYFFLRVRKSHYMPLQQRSVKQA